MAEREQLYSNVLSQDFAALRAGPMLPFTRDRFFSVQLCRLGAALLFRSLADRALASGRTGDTSDPLLATSANERLTAFPFLKSDPIGWNWVGIRVDLLFGRIWVFIRV